ncbi:MAG: DMT family transporter [Planifilum sp.]
MREGIKWVCLASVLWGTAGLVGKGLTADHGLDPLAVAAWRLLISSPLLLVAAWREGRRIETKGESLRPHARWFLLFGLAVAGYQLGYFSAVDRTMVATATLLAVCTAPLFVALVARWAFGERLTFRVTGALVLGLAGTMLLIGLDSLVGLVNPRWWSGNLLALIAALCYGGYILIGKRLTGELPPIRIVAVAFTLGAVFLLPFLHFPDFSWEAWGMILYLGLVPTGVAYMFYITGLNRTTATKASIAALLEPLTATLLAVALLGERLSPSEWAGASLLLFSLFLLASPGGVQEQPRPRGKIG